jgi:hypothetical protein
MENNQPARSSSVTNLHSFDMTVLQSKPVIFSGTSQRVLPNAHPTSNIILSATEDLHIINTVQGASMELASGATISICVPRQLLEQPMLLMTNAGLTN